MLKSDKGDSSHEMTITGTFTINFPDLSSFQELLSSVVDKKEIGIHPVEKAKSSKQNIGNKKDLRDPDRLLSLEEVADYLGVKKSWIYEKSSAYKNGEDGIPSIRLGKYLRFELKKVTDWIESQNKRHARS